MKSFKIKKIPKICYPPASCGVFSANFVPSAIGIFCLYKSVTASWGKALALNYIFFLISKSKCFWGINPDLKIKRNEDRVRGSVYPTNRVKHGIRQVPFPYNTNIHSEFINLSLVKKCS